MEFSFAALSIVSLGVLYMASATLLIIAAYQRGIRTGIALALAEIHAMNCHIDIIVADDKGTVEWTFTRAKQKEKRE